MNLSKAKLGEAEVAEARLEEGDQHKHLVPNTITTMRILRQCDPTRQLDVNSKRFGTHRKLKEHGVAIELGKQSEPG